jgi:hypothetical protein
MHTYLHLRIHRASESSSFFTSSRHVHNTLQFEGLFVYHIHRLQLDSAFPHGVRAMPSATQQSPASALMQLMLLKGGSASLTAISAAAAAPSAKEEITPTKSEKRPLKVPVGLSAESPSSLSSAASPLSTKSSSTGKGSGAGRPAATKSGAKAPTPPSVPAPQAKQLARMPPLQTTPAVAPPMPPAQATQPALTTAPAGELDSMMTMLEQTAQLYGWNFDDMLQVMRSRKNIADNLGASGFRISINLYITTYMHIRISHIP